MLRKQVVLDAHVKSVAELNKTLVQYFRVVLTAVQDYCFGTYDLDLTGHFDREKSEAVRRKSIFDKYFELKHTLVPKDLFLIRSVYIEQGHGLTCPAKTLAIFAHIDDLDYEALPEIVKNINSCKFVEQVKNL
jgi:hypothetical protein